MTNFIQVPCEKHNLKQLRDFVAEKLHDYSVAPSEADMLVLAIDEVCANVMEHEQGWNPTSCLELSIWKEDNRIVFEVQDYAPNCFFDPANYICPTIQQIINERRSGGMGLIIVQNIMDDIKTEKRGCYNIYKFYKNVHFDL